MTAPPGRPADRERWTRSLASLEVLEMDEVVARPRRRPRAVRPRLAPHTVAVRRARAPASRVKLLLGDKTPDGGGVYAKLPSAARVFTVPAYLESAFAKKPFDLRDRDLLHVKRDAVTTLDMTGPAGAYALARDGGRVGRSRAAGHTRPDAGRSTACWATLESLRMESVAAEVGRRPQDRSAWTARAHRHPRPGRRPTRTLEIGSRRRRKRSTTRARRPARRWP